MKEYTLQCGMVVLADANSCLFCEHYDGLLYDSGGVYMTFCDIDKDTVIGASGECQCYTPTTP